MKYYALDICPKTSCGLCNQLYSIVAAIKYCIQLNINILFINKFLKCVFVDNYCNISEILDLEKFNLFLTKYNVFVVDYNNFNLTINNAKLDDGNTSQDITDLIVNTYYKKNNLFIPEGALLNLKNSNKIFYNLIIEYKLNNGFFKESYNIYNNKLSSDINYDMTNLMFEGNFKYKQDDIFFDILRNIPFNETIMNQSVIKINKLIKPNTGLINTIHLRVEDDVLDYYSNQLKIEKEKLRQTVENKYINLIKKYIRKSDTTIILTYSYQNSVIDFLRDNEYNFIIDREKNEDREICAIYDLLLGESCNNYYICVWESSFSYTLFSRINKKKDIKTLQIYYENLNREEDFVTLLH